MYKGVVQWKIAGGTELRTFKHQYHARRFAQALKLRLYKVKVKKVFFPEKPENARGEHNEAENKTGIVKEGK